MDKFNVIGGVFALLGVVFGAFAAHSLKSQISEDSIKSFETGVRYMMYHGLAIIILSTLNIEGKNLILKFFLCGTILFSGSIFLLSTQLLTNLKLTFLGPVTPIGGSLLIIGWIIFIFYSIKF
tara:strand:+ start:21941 stop:22309 length:369 start_codon:yes stop_codon:yes gene_type:complete